MSIHENHIQDTTPDDVSFMKKLIEEAWENWVANEYIEWAEIMVNKM